MLRTGISRSIDFEDQSRFLAGLAGHPLLKSPGPNAGRPAITLPGGKTAAGLPLGLQVVARFGADEELLRWAEQFEKALSSPAR